MHFCILAVLIPRAFSSRQFLIFCSSNKRTSFENPVSTQRKTNYFDAFTKYVTLPESKLPFLLEETQGLAILLGLLRRNLYWRLSKSDDPYKAYNFSPLLMIGLLVRKKVLAYYTTSHM